MISERFRPKPPAARYPPHVVPTPFLTIRHGVRWQSAAPTPLWILPEWALDRDDGFIQSGVALRFPPHSKVGRFASLAVQDLRVVAVALESGAAIRYSEDLQHGRPFADRKTIFNKSMTRFRPCIDLHQGKVKQIVGGSLRDEGAGPTENFVSEQPAGWFAENFRQDGLTGGHVIKLGPGNDAAAREALAAWPGGMQIGGGIHAENAAEWLDAGASHVIVTSALFDADGKFQEQTLHSLVAEIGPEKLVIDLSCRRTTNRWTVAMNRWQTLTDLTVDHATLDRLAPFCDEFLIHAADVEGLCGGIDSELVELLGNWGKLPVTYAGGAATMADVLLVEQAGRGKVDVTVGSALDLFGGKGVAYRDLVTWNHR